MFLASAYQTPIRNHRRFYHSKFTMAREEDQFTEQEGNGFGDLIMVSRRQFKLMVRFKAPISRCEPWLFLLFVRFSVIMLFYCYFLNFSLKKQFFLNL